jgi:phage gp16-like protein
LKNHDKINLIRALNLIKENLHKKREQYLKALLIKQIKTSQNSKEKMTKENKLRMALLKWRSNVISMNYIDNLKKIRKGCKLLKLGLKKSTKKI